MAHLQADDAGALAAANAPPLHHTATPFPEVVYLELADYCNLNCMFCGREASMKLTGDKGGFAEPDKVKMLERPLRAAKYLGLAGRIGDAMLYPKLGELLHWVYGINPGIRLRVTTNGTSLTPKLASLVGGHIDFVSISLNAANAAAYARDMRPVGHRDGTDYTPKWNNLIRRISDFVAALSPGDRQRIRIQAVTHRDNIEDIPAFIRLVAEIGCPQAYVSPMTVHEESRIDTSLYWIKDRYNDVIDDACALGARLGVRVVAGKFYSSVKQPIDLEAACRDPFDIAYLNMEKQGETAPCCQWAEKPIPMDIYRDLGGFERFWNSDVYRRLRQKRDFASCKACGMNRIFDEIMFHFTPFLKRQLISSGRIAEAEERSVSDGHELVRATQALGLNVPSLRRTLLRFGIPVERLRAIEQQGLAALPALDHACWEAFRASDSPASPIDIDMGGSFPGVGWGDADYDMDRRSSCRRLGGGRSASIFVRVATGSAYRLRLTLAQTRPSLADGLSFGLCGRPLSTHLTVIEDGQVAVVAYLPAALVDKFDGRLWITITHRGTDDAPNAGDISFSRFAATACRPELATERLPREALERMRTWVQLHRLPIEDRWLKLKHYAKVIRDDPIGSLPHIRRRIVNSIQRPH